MIEVPEVNTGHTPLEVHFPVLIKSCVCVHLQLPQSLTWHGSVLKGWVVRITPRGSGRKSRIIEDLFSVKTLTCKSHHLCCSHTEGNLFQLACRAQSSEVDQHLRANLRISQGPDTTHGSVGKK